MSWWVLLICMEGTPAEEGLHVDWSAAAFATLSLPVGSARAVSAGARVEGGVGLVIGNWVLSPRLHIALASGVQASREGDVSVSEMNARGGARVEVGRRWMLARSQLGLAVALGADAELRWLRYNAQTRRLMQPLWISGIVPTVGFGPVLVMLPVDFVIPTQASERLRIELRLGAAYVF